MLHTGNQDNVPDDASPNNDGEEDLTPMFWHSTYIIPCFEVTAADVQHIFTPATCSSVHRFCVQTAHSKAACRCRCHYQGTSPQDDRLETDERPAGIGMKTADFHDLLRRPPTGMCRNFCTTPGEVSTALFPRLRLWYRKWLAHSQCSRPDGFYVKKTLLQSSRILASR